MQNTKFKKEIWQYFSRLHLWASKLPASGHVIIVMNLILFSTIFFPWIELTTTIGSEKLSSSAFSGLSGGIGYGVIISTFIMLFFLLSHTKKEQFRSYIPFRLSDTQAIVFVATMMLVAIVQLLIISSNIYSPLIASGGLKIGIGMNIALASVICILISGFFLSATLKEKNTDAYYLGHDNNQDFWEYKNIIQGHSHQENEKKKQNMTLPI